jgi:hypothetical protein
VANTDFEGGDDYHGYGDCIFLVIYAQPSHTTEVTDGLCVSPCFAVPRSIIRYQRVKCSTVVLYLEHKLPV